MALYPFGSSQIENLDRLASHPYPGRFLVMGYAGDVMIQGYAITARSAPSRNRVLERDDDVVGTAVFDPKEEYGDPELTIYDAMRSVRGIHVVSNGKQTSGVVEAVRRGETFDAEMKRWTYEPDSLHTPHITGYIDTNRDSETGGLGIHVVRAMLGTDPERPKRHDMPFHPQSLESGYGYAVHTYGQPLPDGTPTAFSEAPFILPLEDTAEGMVEMLRRTFENSHLVSIAAKAVDASGQTHIKIHNVNQ